MLSFKIVFGRIQLKVETDFITVVRNLSARPISLCSDTKCYKPRLEYLLIIVYYMCAVGRDHLLPMDMSLQPLDRFTCGLFL